MILFIQSSPASAAADAPDLGSAGSYTVLGTNTIPTSGTVTCTNTGPGSTINGDVGSTFTSITNTACSINGAIDAPVTGTVVTDFNNAFSELDSQNPTCDGVIPTTSTILPPGVYCSAAGTTLGAGVTFTLNGSASDVWVFKVGTGGGGALTGTGFSVVMGGNALACNVYWHTAEATTMTDSSFIGTVLAGTAITMTRGSWLGRALAGTDVTVTDADSMTFAGCSPPVGITVNKNFIPDSMATVPVSLSCTSGTVDVTPLSAAEGSPAVFTVGGADLSGTTCTATETVPTGYTANQADCVDVALGGSCTITNTLNNDTVVVNKDFSPNSIASVPVALTCTSGTVLNSPLNASETTPAVFTVNGANAETTCTATETVPPGYTSDQTDCVGVALGDSCTITNTLDSDTVVVNKDFSPNSLATVSVALTCTSGTVMNSPLNASESTPAVFTVNGASSGATCTATETVPTGYTSNQANCVNVSLGSSCTITNTLNSNTVVVNKNFSPDSFAAVSVNLSCTSGTPQTSPLQASEAIPAVFTVNGASPGATCTATETLPTGYMADQSNCVNVALGGSCTITNTVNSDTIVVNKDFSPNNADSVSIALDCSSGTPVVTPLDASETTPAVFTVTGASPGATCTATETVPTGYTSNQSDCVEVALGGSCTISNTLTSNMITVHKNFSPNSVAVVPVALTCTSGTPELTPLNASESTPAVFTVNGASEGATCTATETVPDGYTADQTNCLDVALGGSCTITNTLNSDTIVVTKDFIPNSIAAVPVVLTCTSGEAVATPLNASESAPAVFTVTGASPGATCTATETVPDGYTADQSNCLDVALGSSCEIINQEANPPGRATFRVLKHFTDGNPMGVEVTISCNTGLILDQSTEISESEEVEFVVVSYDEGELNCTVSETMVPGYSPAYTATATTGLGLVTQGPEGCQFDEIISGQFVCNIINAPDLVDIEIEKLWVIDSASDQEFDSRYSLRLYCDEPIGLVDVFEGENSDTYVAQVEPQYPSSGCWVVESVYASGVEIDNGCENLIISAATGGDSCLITNTVFFEGIPTLGRHGMAILALVMLGIGFVGFRRFI